MWKTTCGWETSLGTIYWTRELKRHLSLLEKTILMKIIQIKNGKIKILNKFFRTCNNLIVNKFKKHLLSIIMTRTSIKKCWKRRRKFRIRSTNLQPIEIALLNKLSMLKALTETIQAWTRHLKLINNLNYRITREELRW